MTKKFRKELNLITNNKRITEKLMVIAIYNEIYSDVLEVVNDNSKEYCIAMMEKAFEFAIRYFNTHKTRNVNAERFMRVYFTILRKNEVFNKEPLNKVIANIENSLTDYKNVLSFVDDIEDFKELILERKFDIMLEYREYANDLLNHVNEMFGCDTVKSFELRYSILNVLEKRLSKYLKYCKAKNISPNKIISNLKVSMMKPVKNVLLKILGNGLLNKDHIQDYDTWEYLDNLQELDQDIWFMEYFYEITGYNKYAKALNFNKAEEICEFLGISKIRYTLSNISMKLHSLRSQKNNNSIKR